MTPPVLFFLGRSFKFDQERLHVISSVDITAQAERNRMFSKVILHYARHPRQGIVVKIVFSLRKRRRQHLQIVALEALGNSQEAEDIYRKLHQTELLFRYRLLIGVRFSYPMRRAREIFALQPTSCRLVFYTSLLFSLFASLTCFTLFTHLAPDKRWYF